MASVERPRQRPLPFGFLCDPYRDLDNPRVAEAQRLLGEVLLAVRKTETGRPAQQHAIDLLAMQQPQNVQISSWRRLPRTL